MLEVEGDVFLSSEEACGMLGVKPPTLYAYVSRSLLKSYRQGIRRQRLYRLTEIEKLLQIKPSDRELIDIPLAESWMDNK